MDFVVSGGPILLQLFYYGQVEMINRRYFPYGNQKSKFFTYILNFAAWLKGEHLFI